MICLSRRIQASSSQEVRNESDDDEESVRDKLLHVFIAFQRCQGFFCSKHVCFFNNFWTDVHVK